MSLIPANLEFTFQVGLAGVYRLCARAGNSGDYSCVEVECASVGECTGLVPIFVDNKTCDAVVYNGYVQPTCRDISSTEDRVPFTATFTPNPSCKLYNVTYNKACATGVTITNPGSGYTVGGEYNFSVSGCDGEASGTAVVGSGSISNPVITTPGGPYNDGTYTNVEITGGDGTGALATVVVVGGIIQSITITNPGDGYSVTSPYGLNSDDLGASIPDVDVVFSVDTDFETIIGVTDFVCSAPFTCDVAVAFPIGGGEQAEGMLIIADSPEFDVTGCTGDPVTIPAGVLSLGDTIPVCGYTEPTVDPDAYVVEEEGNCLCGCASATISVTGSPGDQIRYLYNKCGLEERSGVLTVGGSPSSITDCVVAGSVVFQTIDDGEGEVTYGAECP